MIDIALSVEKLSCGDFLDNLVTLDICIGIGTMYLNLLSVCKTSFYFSKSHIFCGNSIGKSKKMEKIVDRCSDPAL
jgi:hypothetical protein